MDISSLITAGTSVASLAGLQVLRDWRDGKYIFKKNENPESNRFLKETRDSQLQLQHHFNDETSLLLNDIKNGVQKMTDKLDNILIEGVRIRK